MARRSIVTPRGQEGLGERLSGAGAGRWGGRRVRVGWCRARWVCTFDDSVRGPRIVAVVVVALVVVGAVAVLLLRQGGSDDPTADARIREELLGDAHPDPTCPDATRAPDARKGQVAISVVRVAKGCLRYRSEV